MKRGSVERSAPSVERVASRVAAGVLALLTLWTLADVAFNFDRRYDTYVDYRLYRDAAAAWLSGSPLYHPFQLAGPYPLFHDPQPILYPPVTLWLLVPFVHLPAVLWWAIPISVAVWALWRLRPAGWAWVGLLVCALWPVTPEEFINGNPVIWAWAAVWAGVVVAGPAAIALFKPTLLPYALIGIRHRAWWLVVAAGFIAALPFGSMWRDYLTVSANLQAPPVYFVRDVPMMAMPVVAWLGSRTRRPTGTPALRAAGTPG